MHAFLFDFSFPFQLSFSFLELGTFQAIFDLRSQILDTDVEFFIYTFKTLFLKNNTLNIQRVAKRAVRKLTQLFIAFLKI